MHLLTIRINTQSVTSADELRLVWNEFVLCSFCCYDRVALTLRVPLICDYTFRTVSYYTIYIRAVLAVEIEHTSLSDTYKLKLIINKNSISKELISVLYV